MATDQDTGKIQILRQVRQFVEKEERRRENNPTLHVHLKGEDPRQQCEECAMLDDAELTERLKTTVEVEYAI